MAHRWRSYFQAGQQAGARYVIGAPRSILSGVQGAQIGSRAGASLDFKDYRDYQPGDDLRHIDWSGYARSDRLQIKLYREEVSPHVDLLVDVSRSMDLPGTSKAGAAAALAAAIATAAAATQFSVAVHLLGDRTHQLDTRGVPPENWPEFGFDHDSSIEESFARFPPVLRSHSIRLLISDLLFIAEPLGILQRLVQDAASTCLIQLLANLDARPEAWGNVRLEDSEQQRVQEVFVDQAAIGRYRRALESHQEAWNRAARQTGASMVTLIAEEVLEQWHLEPLVAAGVLQVR